MNVLQLFALWRGSFVSLRRARVVVVVAKRLSVVERLNRLAKILENS